MKYTFLVEGTSKGKQYSQNMGQDRPYINVKQEVEVESDTLDDAMNKVTDVILREIRSPIKYNIKLLYVEYTVGDM